MPSCRSLRISRWDSPTPPQGVAANLAHGIATGVAGLSVEDPLGRGRYRLDAAVQRMRATREAPNRVGQNVVLLGRRESFWLGQPALVRVLRRLAAYGRAGADCLYVPRIEDLQSSAQVVCALYKPVNANLSGTGL